MPKSSNKSLGTEWMSTSVLSTDSKTTLSSTTTKSEKFHPFKKEKSNLFSNWGKPKNEKKRKELPISTMLKTTITGTSSTVGSLPLSLWPNSKLRKKTIRKTTRRKRNKTSLPSKSTSNKRLLKRFQQKKNGSCFTHHLSFTIPTRNATKLSWWKILST